MKYTREFWYCRCGTKNAGDLRVCPKCSTRLFERYANVRAQERSVVDINRRTGDISVPGRADIPLHPKQVSDGYERVEITSATGRGVDGGLSLSYLESKGLVHEATTYANSLDPTPIEPEIPDRPKTLAELGLN